MNHRDFWATDKPWFTGLGEKSENLKNQGKSGKLREMSLKIIALKENSRKRFKFPFNLLIL